ncbi:ESX secretion-associated protein EspG [Nocardia asteroides]|uniref:ESX secretion-associated protein EspG n=1 Tax=Nocardia asteroides TaxID=1824 RepID=UPI001E4A9087|nr:ESX secretion-associated protein EspG [Nocardia asteroides]UGT64164.1 ESX secretion-associated protein EspG [Nocardia asteroides]
MRRTLTPDQFALAWSRTDGDRIPYPLAVRLSAADNVERAAQLPALHRWRDEHLDADLEAALRVLARPALRVELFGYGPAEPERPASAAGQPEFRPAQLEPTARRTGLPGDAESRAGRGESGTHPADPGTNPPNSGLGAPIRVLGAVAGEIAVVVAQLPGSTPDRGGDLRIAVGSPGTFAARMITPLPRNRAGTLPALTTPLARVTEDSRDLVTVPVSGPSVPARIRRLLRAPRDGIGQIVVSVRRDAGALAPFGVLCWIDVAGDGRYAVRTGAEVEVTPVTAESFAGRLRPMLTAAGRVTPRAVW